MNFEQRRELEPNQENNEMSQEELAKIGERVLAGISQTKEKIEELKNRKQEIVAKGGDNEDALKYIENILPAFEAKLESLEGFAGMDIADVQE
ncbi:MAG: hypothetical protein WC303_00485 [Candidatus Paceibacterota bacterium]|jgi:hypothetical protein